MPEWTAEARDIAEILTVLSVRYNTARNRSALLSQKQRDHVVPSNVSQKLNIEASLLYIGNKQAFEFTLTYFTKYGRFKR